jgi:hypothetical protein
MILYKYNGIKYTTYNLPSKYLNNFSNKEIKNLVSLYYIYMILYKYNGIKYTTFELITYQLNI